MFELTQDPAGYWRLEIAGRIDEAQMKSGLESFLATLQAQDKTDFLYTIRDFELPTLQAVAVEFGYIPRLFAALSRIGKVAVVAEADWLRRAADIEGRLIPGLTIATFRPEEVSQAIEWLTEG